MSNKSVSPRIHNHEARTRDHRRRPNYHTKDITSHETRLRRSPTSKGVRFDIQLTGYHSGTAYAPDRSWLRGGSSRVALRRQIARRPVRLRDGSPVSFGAPYSSAYDILKLKLSHCPSRYPNYIRRSHPGAGCLARVRRSNSPSSI